MRMLVEILKKVVNKYNPFQPSRVKKLQDELGDCRTEITALNLTLENSQDREERLRNELGDCRTEITALNLTLENAQDKIERLEKLLDR